MRKPIILLASIAISAVVVLSGTLTRKGSDHEKRGTPRVTTGNGSQTSKDPPGTIDGSSTPQLIPDVVAYELFLNFFSNRAPNERAKLQAYCKQTGLAGVDLDSIFAVANYYQQQVAPINARAQAIRESNRGSMMQDPMIVKAQLAPIAAEKAALVQEVIAKIPNFVGTGRASAIRQHIDDRIRPHTKIVPDSGMSQTQTQTP